MLQKILQKLKLVQAQTTPITEEWVAQSKAFCVFPWVHLHVTQLGTVTPCCQAPWDAPNSFGNINEQSIAEIWNGKPMCSFRKKMLSDTPDSRCTRCYEKEASGLRSLRQIYNQQYLHKLNWVNNTDTKGRSPQSKPIYWDIRFSNICNFRCRICGPWSSSKWHKDAEALGMTPSGSNALSYGVKNYDDLIGQLLPFLPQVEEIYFAGGEPLIMEEHYRILQLLQDHKLYHIKLIYNTNLSTLQFKDNSITQIWNQFTTVVVAASLDDTQHRAELQRKEQNWQQTLYNRKTLLHQCPHIDFMLSPTLSVLNAFTLPQLHKEWVQLGFIDVANCYPSVLSQPEVYNIRILPPALKQDLAQQYRQHIDWIQQQPTQYPDRKAVQLSEFEHCINYLFSQDWQHLIPQFKKQTLALDLIRNENTPATLPHLAALFT